MNERVNKYYAFLLSKKASNGTELTELSWATDKKAFTLSVWDDASKDDRIKKYGKKWLLNLARQLD